MKMLEIEFYEFLIDDSDIFVIEKPILESKIGI